MRPYPGKLSPLTARRHLVCLCTALCAVSPSLAREPASADRGQTGPHAVRIETHACVDPADPLARPRLQDEPCRLPRVPLPRAEVSTFAELPRWPTPATEPRVKGHGDTLFWRFPVQGRGPHEVPRHSWR